jgi:hypothetical protein
VDPDGSPATGFALLLSGSHPVSMHGLSRYFEGSSEEMGRRVPKLPITLLKGLSLEEAHRLSNDLGKHGVSVVILPSGSCGHYPHADLKLRPVTGNKP